MRLGCILAVGLLLGACSNEGGTAGDDGQAAVLKFTAIPDQNTTELIERFAPVARYLSDRLGVPVEYVPASDYDASVAMFRNGDVHMAWFGGLTGVQARRLVDGAHAIAQGVEDPEFYSYFIAHKDVPLERSDAFPAGIAGCRFTFGSEKSTSGRLMPEHFIKEHTGKSPREFFSTTPGFSGSHPKTAEQVNAGTYEVGVLNYVVYDEMVAAGKVPDTKILWVTPKYADYNITAHPDLERLFGSGFTDRLQAALTAMPGDLAQASFGRAKLIAARDEEFAGIEAVAEDLGLVR